MRRFALFLVVFGIVASTCISAQNLLDNDSYKKAKQLQSQAQQAYDEGDYDQAKDLAQQAEAAAKDAVTQAQQLAVGYRATNLLDLAKQRIQYAQSVDASKRFPDAWSTAQTSYANAQTTYNNKQFNDSIVSSQAVLTALKDITAAPAQPVLPEYYTVRLIPDNRDCFWNIAQYPFVYGDPLKWPLLYQANKQLLQDPNNPNLIQPGMVFKIPSLNGEKREGTYQPSN